METGLEPRPRKNHKHKREDRHPGQSYRKPLAPTKLKGSKRRSDQNQPADQGDDLYCRGIIHSVN